MTNIQTQWKKVEYTRSQIKKAGSMIRKDCTPEERKKAVDIIENWRAAHAYPLQIIYRYLKNMAPSDGSVLVAQRLKRLESIEDKLKRETNMSLLNIQDLGGCRLIANSIDDVYSYYKRYKESKVRHKFIKEFDYIASPKKSGYRSLHAVYEYHSDTETDYNNKMFIEIQFRTKLQHLWATAVETMSLFKNINIKAGEGDEDIKRFFALVSSLFAIEENSPVVPETSNNIKELTKEIRDLDRKHNYLKFLNSIRVANKFEEDNFQTNNNEFCVLSLNYNDSKLIVKRFKASDFISAELYYSNLEKLQLPNTDTVLVRVSKFSELKSTYPNYFTDISDFVYKVQRYIKD